MKGANGRILVPALFAALCVATLAAFFISQRLKRSPDVVQRIAATRNISPNGDGTLDQARIGFRLKDADQVDLEIVDDDDHVVRRLVGGRRLPGGRTVRFRWDGRTDSGRVAPDGPYQMRFTLRELNRTATSLRKVNIDTKPPRARILSIRPRRVGSGEDGPVLVTFQGPSGRGPGEPPPEFLVYRLEPDGVRQVDRFDGRRGAHVAAWDLGPHSRKPAERGRYLIAVRLRDLAGNVASSPRRLPPSLSEARRAPTVEIARPLDSTGTRR